MKRKSGLLLYPKRIAYAVQLASVVMHENASCDYTDLIHINSNT